MCGTIFIRMSQENLFSLLEFLVIAAYEYAK